MNQGQAIQKKAGLSDARKREITNLLFYVALIALPLIQFGIFYIGVNVNSILLAFQSYTLQDGYYFVGFDNFAKVFKDLFTDAYFGKMVLNSLLGYLSTLLTTVFSLLFSFYIYKKRMFSGFFKVILFLPNIISGLILAIMFKYFVDRAVPELALSWFGTQIDGLLSSEATAFPTVIFFNVFIGFGVQVLLFSGAMDAVSPTLIDAAEVDGSTVLSQFIHIILPSIWPNVVTFLVVGVAGIFTNQLCIYSFFGTGASSSVYTIGYYLYKNTYLAAEDGYPYLAAFGIVLTLFAVPLTYLAKYLLERFGPRYE